MYTKQDRDKPLPKFVHFNFKVFARKVCQRWGRQHGGDYNTSTFKKNNKNRWPNDITHTDDNAAHTELSGVKGEYCLMDRISMCKSYPISTKSVHTYITKNTPLLPVSLFKWTKSQHISLHKRSTHESVDYDNVKWKQIYKNLFFLR